MKPLLFFVLVLLTANVAIAQGDGPRSQLLMPIGTTAIVPSYIGLSGNYNFSGSILVPGADIEPEVFLITYTRAFAIGDKYAQVWINPMWGSLDGRGTITDPQTGQPVSIDVSASGLADPIVSFKYGLIGTPALGAADFMKTPQEFQLSAFASLSLPLGDYDPDRLLNIGTNVLSLRLGMPMVVPFASQKTFLEIHPSVTFYESNDEPTAGADERDQSAMLQIETHLSHNFSSKLWASVDLRYQNGGETTTDGVSDDNRKNVLGGGLSGGYSFTPTMSVQASYGETLNSGDIGDQKMFRAKFAFLFF